MLNFSTWVYQLFSCNDFNYSLLSVLVFSLFILISPGEGEELLMDSRYRIKRIFLGTIHSHIKAPKQLFTHIAVQSIEETLSSGRQAIMQPKEVFPCLLVLLCLPFLIRMVKAYYENANDNSLTSYPRCDKELFTSLRSFSKSLPAWACLFLSSPARSTNLIRLVFELLKLLDAVSCIINYLWRISQKSLRQKKYKRGFDQLKCA